MSERSALGASAEGCSCREPGLQCESPVFAAPRAGGRGRLIPWVADRAKLDVPPSYAPAKQRIARVRAAALDQVRPGCVVRVRQKADTPGVDHDRAVGEGQQARQVGVSAQDDLCVDAAEQRTNALGIAPPDALFDYFLEQVAGVVTRNAVTGKQAAFKMDRQWQLREPR